jgi:hypothetical protein
MKIALCFIINYNHELNKEEIWKKWIEPNKDLINIYFYYKDIYKIKSQWILNHIIPEKYIYKTTYYNVIPAYLSLMNYAMEQDINNSWFCFLTESCSPIISPIKFRKMFQTKYNKSIISWKYAWWNLSLHRRANLALLPDKYHLANDPWFIMKREHINQCLLFIKQYNDLTKIITSGGLANESLFAIIMCVYNQLDKNTNSVISAVSHITDWNRCSSPTSPYIFKEGNAVDIQFIKHELERNNYSVFIRKISSDFPDDLLNYFIYEYSNNSKYEYEYDKKTLHLWKRLFYVLSFSLFLLLSFSLFFYNIT